MTLTSDELLTVLTAVANPHRMRIVAELRDGRVHVSELARRLGMSRPLLYMHLDKLEKAGLVAGQLELSEDGKAMKYFELAPFDLHLTAETIIMALREDGAVSWRQHEREHSMTHVPALASGGANVTAISISVGLIFIIGAVISVVVWSYFGLQSHRADAVAMAEYRKLAEEAVANQQELRTELAKLTEHVRAVEQLMRDVG